MSDQAALRIESRAAAPTMRPAPSGSRPFRAAGQDRGDRPAARGARGIAGRRRAGTSRAWCVDVPRCASVVQVCRAEVVLCILVSAFGGGAKPTKRSLEVLRHLVAFAPGFGDTEPGEGVARAIGIDFTSRRSDRRSPAGIAIPRTSSAFARSPPTKLSAHR